MCLISDTTLKELVIPGRRFEDAKKWFEKRDWDSINGRILIYPFNVKNLGPFSYDLSVGEEVFDLAKNNKVSISEKEVFIDPDSVLLVLTKEFVGLPREFAASVEPRFAFVRKGIIQSMTKVDPTWFGRIVVAVVNHSKRRFPLRKGQLFSTLIIKKLDKPCSKVLDVRHTAALGKESIDCFLTGRKKI